MNSYRLSSTIVQLTYFFMSYCPLFKIRFSDFSRLCFHIFGWKLVASFYMKSYRSSLAFVTDDLLLTSYCPLFKIYFPDFSRLCFHISGWKLVASFYLSLWLTYFFMSYCPLFKIGFPDFIMTMFSHIWMKVGRKLPYEKLQIKFHFVTVDLLFNDLLLFLEKSFSALFCLPHAKLHIKFETRRIK